MQRFVYHSAWKGAKMSICEVVEMRNSADVGGYLCSRTASKTPYRCHRRNHGLCASLSSCLRFAAEMSLALSGLMSGALNISCSCSMSSMMRSTSMRHNHLGESATGSNGSRVSVS